MEQATAAAHSRALSAITIAGCALSLLGLAATIAVHIRYPALRATAPTRILLHFCTALACGLLLFIVASTANATRAGCQVVAVLMQYFWLSALGWMVVEGVNLYAIIVVVMGIDFDRRMLIYRLLAWGSFSLVATLILGFL
jgi:G protein-coupled receptor 133